MRVELGGKGEPRNEFALEGSGVDTSGGTPIALLLPDGEDFVPGDYISLGYTHFEISCIGAAGGLGSGDFSTYSLGRPSDILVWDKARTTEVMPDDVWTAYKEYYRLTHQSYSSQFGWQNPIYGYKSDGSQLTLDEAMNSFNPGHTLLINTFSNPRPVWPTEFTGGAGGGGGLHRASGLLADLPSAVPVDVGQVGADAPPGQTVVNGSWTPLVDDWFKDMVWGRIYPTPTSFSNTSDPTALLAHYFTLLDFQNRYPLPHTSFPTTQFGEDGGASSFGDICQASGGKGGAPTRRWSGGVVVNDDAGGSGGVGDQLTAGGGGAGGTSTNGSVGKDGAWDRLSSGQGGGGGRGSGEYRGGKGSFSYADTSLYGPGEAGATVPLAPPRYKIHPGGGGGARVNKTLKYGSKALGFNPNGAVFIRMFKSD